MAEDLRLVELTLFCQSTDQSAGIVRDLICVKTHLLNLKVGSARGPTGEAPPVLISISIPCDVSGATISDNLSRSIDHASIHTVLFNTLPTRHYTSLEALADYAGNLVLQTSKEVSEVHIELAQVDLSSVVDSISLETTCARDGVLRTGRFVLKNLRCLTSIGSEPLQRHTFCFDVTIQKNMDLSHPFDARALAESLERDFEESSFSTLEALTNFVAKQVLLALGQADDVVTVVGGSPNALTPGDSTQLKITRCLADFPEEHIASNDRTNCSSSCVSLADLLASVLPNISTLTPKHTVAIALGSNLGDRFANIETALRLIEQPNQLLANMDADVAVSVINTSFMYETAPMYVTDQPRFANCACLIETNLEPRTLLRLLKKIETTVGRVPSIQNGPRAVDLDILLYDREIIDTRPEDQRETLDNLVEELVVPHPRIAEREFVLRPLADMIPEFVHPVHKKSIRTLLDDVIRQSNIDFPMLKVIPFADYPITEIRQLPGIDQVPSMGKYWSTRCSNDIQRPTKVRLMATLNATPDSFSDGSVNNTLSAALTYAATSVRAGADIIDIGGYSTRPGAAFVSPEEECQRVVPVIQAIRSHEDQDVSSALISIDTFRWEVAEAAVLAGANCINDVYSFTGPEYPLTEASAEHLLKMREVARKLAVPVVLMHSRGDAGSNKDYNHYKGGVQEGVRVELGERVEAIIKGKGGVRRWFIIVDPGIGFSKTVEANCALLREASLMIANTARNPLAGYPQLIGSSRKSFLGTILERPDIDGTYKGRKTQPKERGWATTATVACAVQQGASVVRVHDVQDMRDVVAVASAVWSFC
ncbi:Dihydropteroate synthase-like protein [Suillus paluster]|uniref:Dihydropteroate synthase-like protein n=1 Tax=Suillus paluster TaxID=48578 RepID=UPI001B86E7AB|nr:Dihydropteroate synthase-like protein [Suillus paluster]KAG1740508.1 Dihydropteroate synthase-like protein [Suillus paluster]